MKTGVVIPTYNSSDNICKTLDSVLLQESKVDFIVVVDDCSKDFEQLRDHIHKYQNTNKNITLVNSVKKTNAAYNRNIGANKLIEFGADILFFLDSDDEWSVFHVADALTVYDDQNVQYTYGEFFSRFSETALPTIHKLPNLVKAEHFLFVDRGTFRTSTISLRAETWLNSGFDPKLEKHQDWDLLCELDEKEYVGKKTRASVVLNCYSSNRMSETQNFKASKMFFDKRLSKKSDDIKFGFIKRLIVVAIIKGNFDDLNFILSEFKCRNNKYRLFSLLMKPPLLNKLFVKLFALLINIKRL